MIDPKNCLDLDSYNHELKKKYDQAKIFAETIDRCQRNILTIKHRLDKYKNNVEICNKLNSQLVSQQIIYGDCIVQLEDLKRETQHLKHGLEQARIKALKKFRSKPVLQNISNFKEGLVITEDTIGPESISSAAPHNFCLSGYVFTSNSVKENSWTQFSLNLTDSKCEIEDASSLPEVSKTDECLSPCLVEPLNIYRIQSDDCKVYSENLLSSGSLESNDIENTKTQHTETDCATTEITERVETNDFSKVTESSNICQSHRSIHSIEYSQTQLKKDESKEPCNKCEQTTRISLSDIDKSKQFFNESDGPQFIEFMKTIPLTGDEEIDEEIFNFYRNKFNNVS